jgi:hypothetical protein
MMLRKINNQQREPANELEMTALPEHQFETTSHGILRVSSIILLSIILFVCS